jgi:hypothetical protein
MAPEIRSHFVGADSTKRHEEHIRVIWTHKLFSNCPNLQIILRYLLSM